MRATWRYEWDETKAATNRDKHGVDFADAISALEDELAVTIPDDCPDEERYVTTGLDALGRIVVVASARQAVPRERRQYQGAR